MNINFPRGVKAASYIKEVWVETFPNDKGKTLSKMEARK